MADIDKEREKPEHEERDPVPSLDPTAEDPGGGQVSGPPEPPPPSNGN